MSFFKKNIDSTIIWLSDSHHWAEITPAEMFIHSKDDAATVTRVPFDFKQPASKPTTGFDTTYVHCLTPKNHLISVKSYSSDGADQAVIEDADLNINPISVYSTTFKFPFGIDPELVALSPDGKRIAWKWFHRDNGSTLLWLRRFIPFLPKIPPIARMEVWTSNIDGSDMEEAGYIDKSYPGFPPYPLFWSKDSKKIYFGDGNSSLWAVN